MTRTTPLSMLRALAVSILSCTSASPALAAGGEWTFRALLDGSPIGQHRFVVTAAGDERKVVSEADFTVKVIGITAYTYHHHATEEWHGDCLTAMTSKTDDDGKASSVRTQRTGDTLTVMTGKASEPIKGCVMSFAYWNPAIQTQAHLLNAQTGKFEAVKVAKVGTGSVEVRGKPETATQYRITGPGAPIDVWYSPKGDWVGLDSVVAGGHKLSYRLQ